MSVWAILTVAFAVAFVASAAAAIRGRSTKFVGVLAGVVAVACGWVWWNHVHLEARLAVAATSVAGVDVHVDCQEPFFGEWFVTRGDGRVDASDDGTMDDVAHLDRKVCRAADAWPEDDTDDSFIAVHVLTHEAGHIRGERNEAATECWATQHSAAVGEALGASRAQADRRARWYFRTVYPRLGSGYQDSTCPGPGG